MKRIFAISLGLMFLFLAACAPNSLNTVDSDFYFIQIKNTPESVEVDGSKQYKYEETGYDENGDSKTIQFTTGHELDKNGYYRVYLKDDQFITYEDVPDEALPPAVKEHFSK